jgi:hypothetical protein
VATRLSILEPRSFKDRAKYQAFKSAFGFFPDVLRTMFTKTQLALSCYRRLMAAFHRPSPTWTRGEVELFASSVSSQNGCNF